VPFSNDQLEPGEEVITALQDHWVKLVPQILILVTSWILFGLLSLSASLLVSFPYASIITFVAGIIILLLGHHFFFLTLISYFISVLIITNKRLIEIHYFPFLVDDADYFEIKEIHEIEKKKHGFLQNILNYGSVSFGIGRRPVEFYYLRYPSKFINLIETIKSEKPLTGVDLRKMGASCPEQYKFLLKKRK
jgi:hypothetical protein